MNKYTSDQFAKLPNTALRTIRYYDKEGLLKPFFVTFNGFRYCEDINLVKFQQILLYKYLALLLTEIKM